MTTTRAAPEAVLPPAEQTDMQRLAERVEITEGMVLRMAMAEGRARMSLNGCMAGPELANRIMAWRTAVEAQAKATDELISARNALSAALNQPRED